MPYFGREVKPWVPCRRFAACKRSLNWCGSCNLRQNYQLILTHIVPPFATGISRIIVDGGVPGGERGNVQTRGGDKPTRLQYICGISHGPYCRRRTVKVASNCSDVCSALFVWCQQSDCPLWAVKETAILWTPDYIHFYWYGVWLQKNTPVAVCLWMCSYILELSARKEQYIQHDSNYKQHSHLATASLIFRRLNYFF